MYPATKPDFRMNRWGAVLSIVFWILVWQGAASFLNARLILPLPTPLSTAVALVSLARQTSFWWSISRSLLRICIGFLLALLCGAACAMLAARFTFFRVLTAPLMYVIRSIPVASFTILVFLWVSREKIPSVISFFTVFPILWATLQSGIESSGRELVEMAQVFGMPRERILKEILLPAILPFLRSGAANGIGFAWKSGVAAEIICRTPVSLGNMLWSSKSTVEYDEVFALTFVIVLLSSLLQILAKKIMRGGKANG